MTKSNENVGRTNSLLPPLPPQRRKVFNTTLGQIVVLAYGAEDVQAYALEALDTHSVLGSTRSEIEDAIALSPELSGPLHHRIKALIEKAKASSSVAHATEQGGVSRVRKALADRRFRASSDLEDLLRMAANVLAEDGTIIEHLKATQSKSDEPKPGTPALGVGQCSNTQDTFPREIEDYAPGTWFHVPDRQTLTQFFHSRLPAIREAARALGYAIGVHGSMRRDLDLIATPWVDKYASHDELAHAIANASCGITRQGNYDWTLKPHTRIATSIPICWPEWLGEPGVGHIDLSVVLPNSSSKDTYIFESVIEAWKSNKIVQYFPVDSYDPEWTDYKSSDPPFKTSRLVWRIKPAEDRQAL